MMATRLLQTATQQNPWYSIDRQAKTMSNLRQMPDVTSDINKNAPETLKWVGMEKISLPIYVEASDGTSVPATASIDCQASLDSSAKGIHMSRLYLTLNQKLANQTISTERLEQVLSALLESQRDTSQNIYLALRFKLLINRPALLSNNHGYQAYDVTIKAKRGSTENETQVEVVIPYSSTCPCSAALARQKLSEAVGDTFKESTINKEALQKWLASEAGSIATPHSQRSYAYVKLKLTDKNLPSFNKLISELETAIGTPVQTAVKREDEQAFAELNAQNLIFCEDAGRRLKKAITKLNYVASYWFKVEHQESLHAHNAVVIDQSIVPR